METSRVNPGLSTDVLLSDTAAGFGQPEDEHQDDSNNMDIMNTNTTCMHLLKSEAMNVKYDIWCRKMKTGRDLPMSLMIEMGLHL